MRDLDALYLGGTIGTEAILRGNGAVWLRTDDAWEDPTAANEWYPAHEHDRWAFLVMASDRIPELRSLLPSRTTNASSCAQCAGTGWVQGIICPDCCGLGWLAALEGPTE